MAAIQLARHLGAEVFATASPAKWEALREAGARRRPHRLLARPRLRGQLPRRPPAARASTWSSTPSPASSSTPRCDLLPRGGRFLEMGKTDIRDPEQIAAEHAGVCLPRLRPGRSRARAHRRRCSPSSSSSSSGAPCATRRSPPGTCARRREAFRLLREGRNVGKVVLTVPAPDRPRAHRPDHRRHRRPRRAGRPAPGGAPRRPPPAAASAAAGPRPRGRRSCRHELEALGAEVRDRRLRRGRPRARSRGSSTRSPPSTR